MSNGRGSGKRSLISEHLLSRAREQAVPRDLFQRSGRWYFPKTFKHPYRAALEFCKSPRRKETAEKHC